MKGIEAINIQADEDAKEWSVHVVSDLWLADNVIGVLLILLVIFAMIVGISTLIRIIIICQASESDMNK